MKFILNKYVIAATALIAIIIWMLPALVKEQPKVDPIKKNFTLPTFNVLVERVELESIRPEIRLSGLVKSKNNLIVRSQTSGKVKQSYVSRGDKVAKGTLLIELDEEDFNVSLEKAKANYKTQDINYQSEKTLFEKGLTSKVKLAQAEANLKNAQAELNKAEINFNNRFIKSDFSGEVNQLFVELGDFVSVGSNLMEILDLNNLRVHAELLPSQLKSIAQSGIVIDNFDVQIDHPINNQDNPINAKLDFISKKANPNSRSYPIEVSINQSKELFALEQWITLSILLNKQMAYPIKRSLIFIDQDGDFAVDLVDDQNQVLVRKIEIIKDEGNQVWVVGLNDNEILITRGAGFVDTGDRVNIVQQ